jgi:FixJ family two-component response regulator
VSAAFIAVVDDEVPVRTALRRILRLAGYAVEAFDSGDAFLASVRDRRPDCVLLDINMQGASGFEVKMRLNDTGWDIPTVFITASDDPDLDETASRAGAPQLLRKPFSSDVLLAAIANALGTKPKAS